ncbi:MAG: diaminopimelate decarboxylase [Bacteroidota bacterium]
METRTIYNGPYYRYDMNLLENTIETSTAAASKYNCKMFYAIKANNEGPVIERIREHGVGVDCVTRGEIEHALQSGWDASAIVFAGSGKTVREIEYALSENIGAIHCECAEEFELVLAFKYSLNSTTAIALRINPDIKVDTHAKISTGEKHHKFGMSFEDARRLISEYPREIVGLHFHVGSQITDLSYFEDLSLTARGLIERLPNDYELSYLNLGGGLGIDYGNPVRNPIADFDGWMAALRTHLPESLIETICLEPGRSLVAQCGQLIGEVQYIKHRETNPTAILDIGMTELMRPALYDARHKVTVNKDELIEHEYTISGPTCESSDTFGAKHSLPLLERGDLVTIHSAGAYGSSMRLNYNLREAIPSEYVKARVKTHLKRKVA